MFVDLSSTVLQAVCLIVLFIIGRCVYLRTSPFYRKTSRLPGPKALPFFGNIFDLMGDSDAVLKVAYTKWVKEFGEIYRMFAGNGCYVVISSPIFVEPLLKSQKYIEKGLSYDQILPWLGRGLLTNNGESWKAKRRLLTPAFHFDILKNFVEIFNEQSKTMVKILKEQIREKSAPLDITPFAARCTLDIICEAAMGTKIDVQLHETAFSKSIHKFGEIIMEQFQKPWIMNSLILNMTSLGKDYRRVLKMLNDFSDKVINERRGHLQASEKENQPDEPNGKKKRLALLDLLLSITEDGKHLSQKEIRDEINTFLFAGHDTTSALVSWFLYLMATNPKHQVQVREELFDVLENADKLCSQEDLPQLKYLECCIKETLRLYPSAPGFERMAVDDVRLGEYLVPAGCSILVSVYAMHRNPKYFEDPLTFKPERFCSNDADSRHPFCYIPFSAGPRNCIGQRFAMAETKVILSTLLRHFVFEISPDCVEPRPADLVTLRSLTGVNLIVKPFK